MRPRFRDRLRGGILTRASEGRTLSLAAMSGLLRGAAAVGVLLLAAATASAQTFEAAGTRAAGMGGAFVAVADDASAVYWNPAGLAKGAFFSLVLDHNLGETSPDGGSPAGSESATFVGLAVPALGLTYYRLRSTTVDEAVVPLTQLDLPRNLNGLGVRVSSLVTHHAGVSLVQSLTDSISVGTTLKLVRGVAARGFVAPGEPADLLDRADDLIGAAGNQFDADIGILAAFGTLQAGLAIRNVREAAFDIAGGGEELRLERQVRAGAALTLATGLLMSADLDLERVHGRLGEVRNFALGAEGQLTRRLAVRGGFRVNTLGGQPGGRAPVATAGGSFAAYGSLLVDGQVTLGGEESPRGWGIGARVIF